MSVGGAGMSVEEVARIWGVEAAIGGVGGNVSPTWDEAGGNSNCKPSWEGESLV